jgi:hypothetical protein
MAKRKNIWRDITQYCAKSEHCTKDIITKLRAGGRGGRNKQYAGRLRKRILNDARYAKAFKRK